MHNLQLTEDQDMIVDTVRKFVADEVAPKAQELDEHRTFAREHFDGLAGLGVFGLCVGEAAGGVGMGLLPFVAALEAVGAQSGSLARLWIGQAQAAAALEAAGGDAGSAALGDVVGGALAAFVGPEHGVTVAGGRLTRMARLVPGGEAGRFVVAASDAGAPVLLLVDAAACKRTALRALGLQSAACVAVDFTGATATVLATGAAAASAVAKAQLVGWVGVAAAAIGGGFGAIAAAKKHAGERIAFNKPLLAQEAVQRKLVECRRAVDGARQLAWHAARLCDLGQDATEAAISARVAAVDAMVAAADEAIQIHGGFGYTVEYHVERHYRDGKVFEVLDGGGEALRNRLAALQLA
ncbi:MAG: acyl-CoA dehydrogenase family protein [Planctomycetota bacterium]